MVQTRRIHSCHGQVQAVDLFEEEDEGVIRNMIMILMIVIILVSYLDLKCDMIMMLLLILTKPHPISRLEV